MFSRFPTNVVIQSLEGSNHWKRGVAQSGSAVALGAIGREFESLRPDHSKSTDSTDSVDSFIFRGEMRTPEGV